MKAEINMILESLSENEKIDYAYMLLKGSDNVKQDVPTGVHIIKQIANAGNPRAQFLLYEHYITTQKRSRALEWLRKSFNQNYGEALAMAYYEYHRGNAKWVREYELVKLLKKAVELEVPIAYYFMGKVYEQGLYTYNPYPERAEEYFQEAKDLGFSEEDLHKYDLVEEDIKHDRDIMITGDLRSIFQRWSLPQLFLLNENISANEYNKGFEFVDKLIEDLWYKLVNENNEDIINHPLNAVTEYFIIDDTEDNFKEMLVIQMPRMPGKQCINLAIYCAVVFGNNYKSRFFLGELDASVSNIFLAEYELNSSNGTTSRTHKVHGILDKSNNEYEDFIYTVAKICGFEFSEE